jgi:hypothetical protein
VADADLGRSLHLPWVIWPGVSDKIRRLHDFELAPEIRDWLDGLSDHDVKRVDEVCGRLAEQDPELGGPRSDHLEERSGAADPSK